MIITYDWCVKKMAHPTNKRLGFRVLQNNTRLLQTDGKSFAIQLHSTIVARVFKNGTYELDAGHWRTVTTKDRINYYTPATVGWDDRMGWVVCKFLAPPDEDGGLATLLYDLSRLHQPTTEWLQTWAIDGEDPITRAWRRSQNWEHMYQILTDPAQRKAAYLAAWGSLKQKQPDPCSAMRAVVPPPTLQTIRRVGGDHDYRRGLHLTYTWEFVDGMRVDVEGRSIKHPKGLLLPKVPRKF